ncbi:hypothetical protein D1O33_24985 (plasmid) [Rhodococcus rhodochrous]|nr:hypothetical protein D1O33_24985 [Rhodococcus rhodochrous]
MLGEVVDHAEQETRSGSAPVVRGISDEALVRRAEFVVPATVGYAVKFVDADVDRVTLLFLLVAMGRPPGEPTSGLVEVREFGHLVAARHELYGPISAGGDGQAMRCGPWWVEQIARMW